jgi:hypothetical protein
MSNCGMKSPSRLLPTLFAIDDDADVPATIRLGLAKLDVQLMEFPAARAPLVALEEVGHPVAILLDAVLSQSDAIDSRPRSQSTQVRQCGVSHEWGEEGAG